MIVVGGEALYDLVARDDDVLAGHPGGGPFNTARTIGRLAQPVAFLGRISTDGFGERLMRMLHEDDVELGAVRRAPEPTTLAVAEMDAEGSARYRFYAAETAAFGLSPDEAVALLPGRVDALHVGTLGLVFEPLASALEAAVDHVRPFALVMVDPNCRPEAIGDEPAYRARLERVLHRAHVVKLSEDDARWLAPDRRPIDWARALRDAGVSAVLLTRGRRPAIVLAGTQEAEVPALEVDVVDTIGAGDAFGGAFLAWWIERGLGVADLDDHGLVVDGARFAARVAAITCTRPGASPPRLAELRDTS